jgi:predicted deacylase
MRPSVLTLGLAASGLTQSLSGDVYLGYPVLDVSVDSPLDLASIPANTISRYWLRPGISQGNIPYFLPVMIARGSNESLTSGRKLSLSASIHGDELNGPPVIQRVFAQLNSSGIVASGSFNGTIIGIPQLNPQGNFLNGRNFYTPASSGFLTNLNRILPGSGEAGESLTDSYVSAVWYGLWGNGSNVDVAVDLHTLSTGSDGPLWAYADYAAPYVRRLAELAAPDVIKIDPGEPGSVETTFVQHAVPAITLEIGPAKVWSHNLISRAEGFVWRLLVDLAMLGSETNGTQSETATPMPVPLPIPIPDADLESAGTYIGANFSSVVVGHTGWVNVSVDVLDDVDAGQEVGVVYDWFGDVLETLVAGVGGRVLQARTDPAVEAGVSVVQIVYNATDAGGEGGARRVRRDGGGGGGFSGRARVW